MPPATLGALLLASARTAGRLADDRSSASAALRTGDLLRDRYDSGWDLILCRNVVIYFTPDTRNQVHTSLARALRDGGHLMVGATERVSNPAAIGLEPAWPFVYRKAG